MRAKQNKRSNPLGQVKKKMVSKQVSYVKFASKRRFGVELEFSNLISQAKLRDIISKCDGTKKVQVTGSYAHDFDNNFWHVKADRSCGEIVGQLGWEITSYVCSGVKDIIKIVNVVDELEKNKVPTNNRCAFHVHVEIKDFNIDQFANAVAQWIKIESIMEQMLPQHRITKYCVPLTQSFAKKIDFSKKYTSEELVKIIKPKSMSDKERRVSMNFCNYFSSEARRTLELRLPENSVNSYHIKNWIKFFVFFIENTLKMPCPDNLLSVDLSKCLEIVGLSGGDSFYLLSPGLRETKIWLLNRIVFHARDAKIKEDAMKFLELMTETEGREHTMQVDSLPVKCIRKRKFSDLEKYIKFKTTQTV